jgi:DNA-binding PadR family transcriptional regulator
MYWMHGEELGSTVSSTQLEGLLNSSSEELELHFNKLVEENFLIVTISEEKKVLYQLSEKGRKEAGKRFASAFEGLQKAGHGECGPDCEFCYGENGEKLENCVHNCAESHVSTRSA